METSNDKKFTLLHYRPNGSEYIGGGDREHYDSEISFDRDLSMGQLKHRITELTKRRRYEDESDCEFIVLLDGKPIVCRGESLWSFETAISPCEEAGEISEAMSEASVLSQKEKYDQMIAKSAAEAERQKKAIEENERRRYREAQQTIREFEAKQVKP